MKNLILSLLLMTAAAFAQQRATVYDLGPQVQSSHIVSNGYPWRAWGYVYARGAYTGRDACTLDESLRPVGVWVIQGSTGDPSEYSGVMRVTVGSRSVYFGGVVTAIDEDGFPLSSLFDAKGAGDGGKVEITPRSTRCFGGELKIFQGE